MATAIDMLERFAPNVLVSDLGLPDGDGYDLIARARKIQRSNARDMSPAIAVTGFGGDSERRRVLGAGYQTYVLKPVDPFDLVEIIARVSGRVERC